MEVGMYNGKDWGLGRIERTDGDVVSVRISQRELHSSSVGIHMRLFQPADERAPPWQSYVKVVDPEEQEDAVARLVRTRQRGMLVGTPLVWAFIARGGGALRAMRRSSSAPAPAAAAESSDADRHVLQTCATLPSHALDQSFPPQDQSNPDRRARLLRAARAARRGRRGPRQCDVHLRQGVGRALGRTPARTAARGENVSRLDVAAGRRELERALDELEKATCWW